MQRAGKQPWQPKESPILPNFFTQIYILVLMGFCIGSLRMHKRFRIGLPKMHIQFRFHPPKMQRKFAFPQSSPTKVLLTGNSDENCHYERNNIFKIEWVFSNFFFLSTRIHRKKSNFMLLQGTIIDNNAYKSRLPKRQGD